MGRQKPVMHSLLLRTWRSVGTIQNRKYYTQSIFRRASAVMAVLHCFELFLCLFSET